MKARSLILATLGLFILSACGKWAKAKKQDVITVNAPRFPDISDNVFALKGAKQSVSYKSTMLILNPAGEPAVLADLIKASELTRVRAAEARAFIGNEKDFDNRYGDSGSLVQEIKKKEEDLRIFLTEAQSRATPVPLDVRQKSAADWFVKQQSELGLSPDETQRFENHWAEYCDAKIIELAVHPLFAKLSNAGGYSERPSPLQLCENYYSSRSYFQSLACTQGDYFQCIWSDGVLKSGVLSGPAGQDIRTFLEPVLSNQEQTEIFRKILLSDAEISAPYFNLNSLSAVSQAKARQAIYDKKNFVYGWMLSGTGSFGNEVSCKKLLNPIYSFVCGIFARSWKENPPQFYLSAVEFNSSLVVNKENAQLRTVNNIVKYFGQRPLVGTPQNSNSDFLFHATKTPGSLIQPTADSLGLTQKEITEINNTFTDTLFALSLEDKASKTLYENSLKKLQADLEFHRDERTRLANVAGEALRAGIRAANGGTIGLGFIAYRMIVTNEDDFMRAAMSFEGFPEVLYEACFDKIALTSTECPIDTSLSKKIIHKAELKLNPIKGRIEFSFLVDQPESFGLGPKAKNLAVPDYFMNLAPVDIQGTTLRFELYPNRLNNALDILTGKALFARDGLDLYEAGVSMWEE